MRPRTILASVILLLACGLMLPDWASAAVVGHITQVEGRVDLLKGGKLPATPVALQDKVESGDVLRAKSLSKAQITFIDNSVITLSPESRLAVDEYRFEPAQQKRFAVLNLFQGMAHVVVNKLFKMEEPDFVIKTHTAVLGVRGTDFGIRLQPNASTILNFQGITQVANIFPEVGKLDRRAFKAAYAFGPPGSPNSVMLQAMQGTTVGQGLPPTLPFSITAQDQQQFMNQLSFGVLGRQREQGSGSGSAAGSGSGSESGGGGSSTGGGAGGGTEYMTNLGGPDSGLGTPVASSGITSPSVPLIAPTGLTTGTGDTTVTALNTVTIPPVDTSTQTASLPPPPPP
ncbi:MAG: FecR family protein, partial [Proteobacteria bacterium]|nr:FecR family protein [Pseudomonadota bacterium]